MCIRDGAGASPIHQRQASHSYPAGGGTHWTQRAVGPASNRSLDVYKRQGLAYGIPLNENYQLNQCQLIAGYILLQGLKYTLVLLFVSTHPIGISSPAPEMPVSILVFQICTAIEYYQRTFCATLIFSGTLTDMVDMSPTFSASIIVTSFCSHSLHNIRPMSAFIFP